MSKSGIDWRGRVALGIVIFCSACMVYYHLAVFVPRAQAVRTSQGFGNGYSFGADFYPIWLAAREGLLHHRDPYSAELTRDIQTGLFGKPLDAVNPAAPREYRAFAYPAFTELLFWPTALLPFSTARIILAVLLPGVTALGVWLWLRMLRLQIGVDGLIALLVLTLSSYPVLEGMFAEQMGLLVGCLLAAAFAALVQRRLFLSGMLMALTLIKPQMIVLVAAFLLLWNLSRWRERWPLLAGFFATASLMVGCALLIWPHWIGEWLNVVFGYRNYSTPPLLYYVLGSSLGATLGPILISVVLVGALTIAWRMRRCSAQSKEFSLVVSLLLAITTITILPGHAVYDHVVLMPGLILIALHWREFAATFPARAVLALTALAIAWPWLSAPFVIALRPFVAHDLFVRTMLTLPIRTAASIPFGVCALLLMMWRVRSRETRIAENVEPLPTTIS
jgi:hypothetical protein